MYAIIATGGKQYKVSEGDVIKVEKLDAEAGQAVTFDQVIAISDGALKVGEDVKASTLIDVTVDGMVRLFNFTPHIQSLPNSLTGRPLK